MEPDVIQNWRPPTFKDIVGATNQRRIRRLQIALRHGRHPSPLLLVGVFGYGKTSLARLLQRSLNCERRDPITADPCGSCEQCLKSGVKYNECGYPFMRYEYDCTTLARADVIQIVEKHFFGDQKSFFWDELHHLNEKHCQEPLLKFLEDFRGLFVAAIMEDRLKELIPPLRERFDMLKLVPPERAEIILFFQTKIIEWRISNPKNLIPSMVDWSGMSFRACLRVLAAAVATDDRVLTEELIRDILGMD